MPVFAGLAAAGAGGGGAGLSTKAILSLTAVGVGIQAYSQYQAGVRQQQQDDTAAAWHRYNAEIARREREEERIATAFEVKQAERRAEQRQKRLRSLIGGANVNIEGSPLLVDEDLAEQSKLEQMDIITRGTRRASFFESQSILDTLRSSTSKSRGAAARRAGFTSAVGTSIQGAARTGLTAFQLRNG
jgi:hypothetical protein